MEKLIKIFIATCMVVLSCININANENETDVTIDDKNGQREQRLVLKPEESSMITELKKLNSEDLVITFKVDQNSAVSISLLITDEDDEIISQDSIINFETGDVSINVLKQDIKYTDGVIQNGELVIYNKSGEKEIVDITDILNAKDINVDSPIEDAEVTENKEVVEVEKVEENILANTPAIVSNNTLPTIDNIEIKIINYGSYLITAKVNAQTGINRVVFPTWTDKNGQDDILWTNGVIDGDSVSFLVDMKNHNYETGCYNTHIYAYDNSGNIGTFRIEPREIISEVPIITNPVVESISSGSYRITLDVADSYGIAAARFATWTEKGGQDDILWRNGIIANGKATYVVEAKDYNYEAGNYITHVFVENYNGLSSGIALKPQLINKLSPTLENIAVNQLNSGSYEITAKINSYIGVNNIQFPTWTNKNGQDDIIWKNGVIFGDVVSCIVDIKDHNFENGIYSTHLYIQDRLGNEEGYALADVKLENKESPTISNWRVSAPKNGKYLVQVDVVDDYSVNSVKFPTWSTANGQDDMVWGVGKKEGNTYSYEVNIRDHNYEFGDYLTHIYAYDGEGKISAISAPTQTFAEAKPLIKNAVVSELTAGYYVIEAEVSDDIGIDRVMFPTWTAKNGQDDMTWEAGIVSGNKVRHVVWMDNHNFETGDYITHIYAYNKAGVVTAISMDTQIIVNKAPVIKNVTITNKRADGYTINAEVTDDYKVKSVEFPTWTSKNGQDDIIWERGKYNNGVYSYDVKISQHSNEVGPYITHIFATDVSGEMVAFGMSEVTVENSSPVISNMDILNKDSSGYTVSCIVKDDLGVSSVQVPTWTEKGGKNDILWGNATHIGNGVYQYRVNTRDHGFESGNYISHIYAFDSTGGAVGIALNPVSITTSLSPGWVYENGRKYLFNNQGKVVEGATKSVIDVSEHQGSINWQQVKDSGVDSVILRCGYGWQDDLSQIDKTFNQNANELERLGIPYGVYLFSYANNAYDAEKEAEYALRIVNGRRFDLPIYYDLEYDKIIGDVSPATYTVMAHAFCQTIERGGYPAGIYANLNYWNNKLFDPSLDRYTKWVAQFNTNDGMAGHCDYTKAYKVWQYTSIGKVPGINGNVDMNAWF